MPVPRHAWWRGERDDVATTGPLTGDVAGSAAPPILARQCRAIPHGAAGPGRNINKACAHSFGVEYCIYNTLI